MTKDFSRYMNLKIYRFSFVLVLMLLSSIVIGQEICDNGIDDDGDGKIDLLDEDCNCTGFTEHIKSLIPNPSFEKNTEIPWKAAQLDLAEGWSQATSATTDYIHKDGFKFAGIIDMPLPIPDGDACAGFFLDFYDSANDYVVQEYLGANLIEPMEPGIEYTLTFDMGFGEIKSADLGFVSSAEMTIYGRPDETSFPINTYQCPMIAIAPNENPEWEVLGVTTVENIDNGWEKAEMTFTPTKDYKSIILGGSCSNTRSTKIRYVFLDNLICSKSSDFEFGMPTTLGSVCEGTLELTAPEIDLIADYQWYKDGIAIIGETGKSLALGDAAGEDGYYQVGVSYYNECMVSDSIYITGNDDNLQIIGDTVLCHLEKSQLSTSHNYDTYKWSTGAETQRITVDQAGIYSLTVTTSTCEYISEVTVREVPEIIVSGAVTATEFGKSEGAIVLSIQGGEAPFTFQWLDGPVSQNRNNIPGGPYSVTVQDRNGCQGTQTFQIHEVPSILVVGQASRDIDCFGDATGEIYLNIQGGIPPYNTTWNHTTAQLDTITGLTAATYRYTVEDQSKQIVEGTITINEPAQITSGADITHVQCYEDENGEIILNPQGGVGNYSFNWSKTGVGNVNSISDLTADTYKVEISDENNCVRAFDIEITEPDLLAADINFTGLKCFGVDDAEITISSITGGTQPYHVLINGEKQRSNFKFPQLSSGDYTVTIVDNHNCTFEEELTIDEMSPVNLSLTADKTSVVRGETVEFELDGVPSDLIGSEIVFGSTIKDEITSCFSCTEFTDIPLRSSEYFVDLINGNCTYSAQVYIEVESKKIYIPTAFTPNADGNNDVFLCYSNISKDILISDFSIYNRNGERVYNTADISLAEMRGWDGFHRGHNAEPGVYSYVLAVIDSFGKKEYYRGTIELLR